MVDHAAEAALPFAIQMARRYGSKVFGVHVRPIDIFPGAPDRSWPVLAEETERPPKKMRGGWKRACEMFPTT